MASLKFLTWNVRGMREKFKRAAVFTFLKKQHADIIALVETHVEGSVQMALRRPWVGWAYHSTHTSYSRGVSVLIARSVHFELCELSTDPLGRYVFILAKLYGEPLLIMAFYIPPPFNISIIKEGLSFMARHSTISAVWLGDFNTTLNPTLDRLQLTSPTRNTPNETRFSKLISTFHLIDTWRHKFPQAKSYSCFSSSHGSMSRIDFILISRRLTPRLSEAIF